MPMDVSVMTYVGTKLEPYLDADLAREMAVQLTISAHYAKGTILALLDATGKYGVYADAGSGGLGIARCILAYDVDVDSAGLHTLTTSSSQIGTEIGTKMTSVPAFFRGTFRMSDLIGMDLAAVADLNGRLAKTYVDSSTENIFIF